MAFQKQSKDTLDGAVIKALYEEQADTNAFTDADAALLDSVEPNATANSPDATLVNRANHTGTQPLSTISDAGTMAAKDVWSGTQAAYDALGTYDANTIYLITG